MAERLSICMFSNLYPPVVSGSSTQSSGLAQALVRRGHQVTVITARLDKRTPPECDEDGVMVYRLPAWRLPKLPIALNFPWLNCTYSPANFRLVREIIARHDPDVLHLHNHMFDLAFSAGRISQACRRPLMITIHTIIKHRLARYNLLLTPADRIFLRHLVIRKAWAIICPDVNVDRYVREAFDFPNRAIIPYGLDFPQPPEDHEVETLRDRFRLHGRRVVLSLGHVHEIRNRRDLVAAWPEVLRHVPEAKLVIVGAEACTIPRDLARQLGIEQHIIFTGPMPHHHVAAWFKIADMEAHWLNQEEPEKTSLGVASLEAMATGKVVLSAANPDTYGPGLLRSGENLLMVRPGDISGLARTIVELFQDSSRREAIGRQAALTVRERFSWEAVAGAHERLYQESKGKTGTMRGS